MECSNDLFELTLSQMDIYLDQIKTITSPKFNIGGYIKLRNIDGSRLAMAHQILIERYDAFGIRIVGDSRQPMQSISGNRNTGLPIVDFSTDPAGREKALAWVNNAFSTPFHLENSELFNAWLIRIDASESWYVGIAHHIINDGFGFINWTKRLADIYNHENPPVGLRWHDIATRDTDYVHSEKYLADRQYWSEWLQRTTAMRLKPVHSATENESHNKTSGREIRYMARQVYNQWVSVAQEHGLTLYHLIAAAIAIAFFRSENTDQVAIGIPVHNRRGGEQKNVIGVFTNITPLYLDIAADMRVLDVAMQVKARQKQGISHNRFPLGHISQLAAGLHHARHVFDVSFNYLKVGGGVVFGEQPSELFYLSHYHDDTPLNITLWESGSEQEIEFHFDYNFRYFNAIESQRLADRMMSLFDVCARAITENVCQIAMLPAPERRLIRQFAANQPAGLSPQVPTSFLHLLVERQAAMTPDNVALIEPSGHSLRYVQLNRRANRLAGYLRQQGVCTGDPVVLCASAGCDATVGMLAILKSGAVCVPVDLRYPAQRIQYAITQSGSRFVLVDTHANGYERLSALPHGCREIALCRPPCDDDEAQCPDIDPHAVALTPDSAAYIIYTSGSTGKSKGVEVVHGALAQHILNINRCYRIGAADRCLQTASISFDAALEQLFVPLSCGASVHFVDLRMNDVDSLVSFIEQRRITVADLTASYVSEFLNLYAAARPQALLRLLIVGNECFYSTVLRRCLAVNLADRVINAYGPTEAVITSTLYEVQRDALPSGVTVPIGRAVPGNRTYIVGRHGQLNPIGSIGELLIAGESLARRYIHDDELTASKFIVRQFIPGINERCYATGDLVRFREDGNIEYIGRKDGQLKIRGHRVELLEIESALLNIDEVKHALVNYQHHEQEHGRLVAYVVPRTEPSPPAMVTKTIKSKLRARLPDYMIPSQIIIKPQFPQLPNGKMDVNSIINTPVDYDDVIFKPVTPVEIRLEKLWREILSLDDVDIHTSFFSLGGDSLLAIRLNASIKDVFSVSIPVELIFNYPTLHEMAMNIDLIRDRVTHHENHIQSQFNTEGFL
ncbi:non-ribosomal peptide synthetase [Musicola paradisiaca]|uniref:Amino acid adenylation domain protein n=1 Tax=Musicola paradisiaca (strain Ech703) TaxID=579405 RepID=C6C499_MUSP7|nr:non-ribosomal peptide synthetase [Musicola paradisiaca]ACS85473.1 amino acid adenylation domain protein [Musicola paradisiaca Ech703]